MALELKDLKKMFDRAFLCGQDTREKAANDMVFYYLTQWDDALLNDSTLGYKGEFNILKKAGREILSDLGENPIQIDFSPKGNTSDETADLIDGMYRTEDSLNSSLMAYEIAENEAVVCGCGAWEIDTEYEDISGINKNQIIKRRLILEANNRVFWDPDAKMIDKSDANWVFKLDSVTPDGYKALVNDLTGEDIDEIKPSSFSMPEESYSFPWVEGNEKIYIGTCYKREKVKEKLLMMSDPFGDTQILKESSLIEVMDEMIDLGFAIEDEKTVEVWQVKKYIMSGKEILSEEVIPGEHLRIIPFYGEYAYINGEPHWEGITRLAKDPSRLRNFAMSYLGDILSRSPRPKPIFFQEQISGYEYMFELSGADNNYPYLLQNRTGQDGQDLPIGPVGMMPDQPVPQSLATVLGETRTAVADVANSGMVEDVTDVDLSGRAVNALNARIDKQSFVYQIHKKHAKRRDSVVFLSIAKEIYDVPRAVIVTAPDGTRKEAQIMQSVMDKETGDIVVLNDLASAEFEVFSTIGTSYSSQKEQVREQLLALYQTMDRTDPMRKAVELELITMMEGSAFKSLKEYARKQLVLMEIKEPETPEEEKMLAAAKQQPKEPTADMVLALAEQGKAEAEKEKNQIELMKLQANARNEQMKRVIDEFKAQTDRMETQITAQEAGATIDYKRVDTFGKELDNVAKVKELQEIDMSKLSDDELYKILNDEKLTA